MARSWRTSPSRRPHGIPISPPSPAAALRSEGHGSPRRRGASAAGKPRTTDWIRSAPGARPSVGRSSEHVQADQQASRLATTVTAGTRSTQRDSGRRPSAAEPEHVDEGVHRAQDATTRATACRPVIIGDQHDLLGRRDVERQERRADRRPGTARRHSVAPPLLLLLLVSRAELAARQHRADAGRERLQRDLTVRLVGRRAGPQHVEQQGAPPPPRRTPRRRRHRHGARGRASRSSPRSRIVGEPAQQREHHGQEQREPPLIHRRGRAPASPSSSSSGSASRRAAGGARERAREPTLISFFRYADPAWVAPRAKVSPGQILALGTAARPGESGPPTARSFSRRPPAQLAYVTHLFQEPLHGDVSARARLVRCTNGATTTLQEDTTPGAPMTASPDRASPSPVGPTQSTSRASTASPPHGPSRRAPDISPPQPGAHPPHSRPTSRSRPLCSRALHRSDAGLSAVGLASPQESRNVTFDACPQASRASGLVLSERYQLQRASPVIPVDRPFTLQRCSARPSNEMRARIELFPLGIRAGSPAPSARRR